MPFISSREESELFEKPKLGQMIKWHIGFATIMGGFFHSIRQPLYREELECSQIMCPINIQVTVFRVLPLKREAHTQVCKG